MGSREASAWRAAVRTPQAPSAWPSELQRQGEGKTGPVGMPATTSRLPEAGGAGGAGRGSPQRGERLRSPCGPALQEAPVSGCTPQSREGALESRLGTRASRS